MADLGFKQISVEPVVAPDGCGYELKAEDLPQLYAEYEALAKEYEAPIQSHLEKAICQTVAELHMGKSEEAAYEKFGEQIGLRPYKRLAAILSSQSSRGGGGIKEALRREVQEAWELQKEEVKRMGNEAETKLIIPMLGMMIIVFSIVVIPAFFSLSF